MDKTISHAHHFLVLIQQLRAGMSLEVKIAGGLNHSNLNNALFNTCGWLKDGMGCSYIPHHITSYHISGVQRPPWSDLLLFVGDQTFFASKAIIASR